MDTSTRELLKQTQRANKDHQRALKAYTQKLEEELETINQLLDATKEIYHDEDDDVEPSSFVYVPGASKPAGYLTPNELAANNSPFRRDALRRTEWLAMTESHPMKTKELEVLAEAVKGEVRRLDVMNSRSGQDEQEHGSSVQEVDYDKLNWERVAERVSSVSMTIRSAKECEIKWKGERQPSITRLNWKPDETFRLRSLISSYGEQQVDWVKVAEQLGTGRTPIDCIRHSHTRKGHMWTPEYDARLLEAVEKYGINNWPIVARYVSENASPQQCNHRYSRTLDPTIKHGTWSPEEDERLRKAVQIYGLSWIDVALFIPGRTNDQCRERWSSHHDPAIHKADWAEDEDKRLQDAVAKLGDLNWSKIAELVGHGKTQDMCRVRYHALFPTSRPSSSPETPESEDDVSMVQTRPVVRRNSNSELFFMQPIIDSYPKKRARRQKRAHDLAKPNETAAGASPAANDNGTPAPSEQIQDTAEGSSLVVPPPKKQRARPRQKKATIADEASQTPQTENDDPSEE